MAETTRTTSGTPTPNTAASASPGGARNTSNPSSTTPNPSSTTAASPAATSATASASPRASTTSATTSSAAHGQRPQSQQHQADRPGERRADEYHAELSGNAMRDARKVGSELVGAARDSAVSLIDAQRGRAADQIVAVGNALRRSTESLESIGPGALVQYINQAADQVSGFADTVRDRTWNDLAGDLEGFARRSPTMFMASAVGIGFLLGRFLLSSSNRSPAAGTSSMSMSGGRPSDMRRDVGVAGRPVSSSARAESGGSGLRE